MKLTAEQRKQVAGILQTHLHNMATEASEAHGKDDKKEQFYLAAYARTEALIPLFADYTDIEDEDEDTE